MKHEEIVNQLSYYIDDLLDEREMIEIDRHLKECPECYENYLEMKKVLKELNELGEVELPAGFEAELLAKLVLAKEEIRSAEPATIVRLEEVRATKKKSPLVKWKFAYSTAAALLLLVAGTAYFNSQYNFLAPKYKAASPEMAALASPTDVSTFTAAQDSNLAAGSAPAEGTESQVARNVAPTADLGGGTNENPTLMMKMPTEKSAVITSSLASEFTENKAKVTATDGSAGYGTWAKDIIESNGGTLLTTDEVLHEALYTLPVDNFLHTLDLLVNATGTRVEKTDLNIDWSTEYQRLNALITAGGEEGEKAKVELENLQEKLKKAYIIISPEK